MAEIKIQNLCFSYAGEHVLENISLEVRQGDFLGIIGANGGGKSTLLKLILGLLPCSQKIYNSFSHIGYVPQHTSANPFFPLNAFECVLMGTLSPRGQYTQEDRARALESMKTLKIEHLKNKKMQDLSGGQRQKVLIARAICTQAPLIILDEPTASLDRSSTQEIFSYLHHLNTLGATIITICHDLELLLEVSTHIAHLKKTLTFYTIPKDSQRLIEDFGCKHHLIGECDA